MPSRRPAHTTDTPLTLTRRSTLLGAVGASAAALLGACTEQRNDGNSSGGNGSGGDGSGGDGSGGDGSGGDGSGGDGSGGDGSGGAGGDAGQRCLGDEALFVELTATMEAAITAGTLDGAGLLLCDANGVCYQRSFGIDTDDTAHLLASATKLASTTAMMTLVDDGSITLDDSIDSYLPLFGPSRGAITIRQLLNQTHGLPFSNAAIALPGEDNGLTLEQAVDQIAQDDWLLAAPGTLHYYRPAVAYHIAGRIAEVVTGKPWAALFAERVGGPLNMATFDYGDTLNPRVGGGGKATLTDYGNLLRMHLSQGTFDGAPVLSAALVAEMQQDQLNATPFRPSSWGATVGYGLSWWFDTVEDSAAMPLDARRISVPGAYGSVPWIDRARGYGGFLLVDDGLDASYAIYENIAAKIEAAA